MFEQAGITTVNIGLIRGQLETSKPPRSLYVEFPLGRPLGRPDDIELQTAVLNATLELASRDDGPFIVDYPEVIAEEGDEPAACTMPPRHDPELHPAIDEARGIRNAYQRNVDATGRTLLGRVTTPDADGVVTLIEQLIRLENAETLDEIGWDSATTIAAGQDIRAYYEEAGLQLAENVVGSRSLESWFYSVTEAGQLIRRAQKVMKEQGTADDFSVQYLLPGTQAR
ncbi:MAG: hypothetical protein AB8G26_04695 [Ilumatobacter sp.]